MKRPAVAVLVPAFNEAGSVGQVVAVLRAEFDSVIVVDDGSTDETGMVARGAGATVLTHPFNLGQGAALRTGFEYVLHATEFTHLVTFDADGQHAVGDALAMLHVAMTNRVEVVLGSRTAGAAVEQPLGKRLVLQAGLRISRWHSGLDLTDTHNGLRVLSRRALSALTLTQRGMAHASEIEALIAHHGLAWVEHPVTISYTEYSRAKGQSSLNAFNILYDLLTSRLRAS